MITEPVSGTPRQTGRRTLQVLDLPLIADRWWVQEVEHNAALFTASGGRVWEVAARTVDDVELPTHLAEAPSGTRIAWSRGGWLLVDLGDGSTLAEYWVWSDPGGALPAGLVSRFATGTIRGLMSDVGTYAAELARSRPRGFVRPDQQPLG